MFKTTVIKNFFEEHALPDLAALYNPNMEVHVNVYPGKDRIQREFQGHKYFVYTDGTEEWKPIRIPWSNGDFNDAPLRSSTKHWQAIGMSGWDWKLRQSVWFGFDFDSVIGHKKGLSESELESITEAVTNIEWITVRKSTSGRGLHLYAFVENSPIINSRAEHAAAARCILGRITAIAGVPLSTMVDCQGLILWQWHANQGDDGFICLKEATEKCRIPSNWKQHLPVVEGKQTKIRSGLNIDVLVAKMKCYPLTKRHIQLINWLDKNKCQAWWDADRSLLTAHTYDLKQAHRKIPLKGPFETISTESGADHNCFLFPLQVGWVIRRYTQRTPEHHMWDLDPSGWTRCYFDRDPDLATACRLHHGVENSKHEFVFQNLHFAKETLVELGIPVPDNLTDNTVLNRQATIIQKDEGTIILRIPKENDDNWLEGWAPQRKSWERVFYLNQTDEKEVQAPDELVRHVITNDSDSGWFIFARSRWVQEPLQNIKLLFKAMNVNANEANTLLGQCVLNPWTLQYVPFASEYLGDRGWNKADVHLAVKPKEGEHPYWDQILSHIGQTLDDVLYNHPWAKRHQILTGKDYLTLWLASIFQDPAESLPYLFLYGPENSGKSILHEATRLLLRNGKGVIAAKHSLISEGGFNAELSGSILCVVEEVNLQKKGSLAYNRIKDWVTGESICIHEKFHNPIDKKNFTHWIQCGNNPSYCPIFPGDTRITLLKVPEHDQSIPKRVLLHQHIKGEAAAFLHTLLTTTIPESKDRLRIPAISTFDKMDFQGARESAAVNWWKKITVGASGYCVYVEEAYQRFIDTIPEDIQVFWPYTRFIAEVPHEYITGRTGDNRLAVANRCIGKPIIPMEQKYVKKRGKLVIV